MEDIVVNNLTKIYKQRKRQPGFLAALKTFFQDDTIFKTAVEDVSFVVEEGEVVGLLGPNGAGKTTVLKVLSGILYPTEGNIKVVGHIPYLRENEFKKKISLIVGQKNQMMWDLPAIDTLLWLKEIYDIPKSIFDETIKTLVSIFHAEDLLNLQVRRMSLGQRMKMELVASMLHKPKVIFLDEPTIGLDVMSQNNFRHFIKEYNKQTGATIILTSHNLLDVEVLCSKVILINEGRITHNRSLKDLTDDYDYKLVTLEGIEETVDYNTLPYGVELVSEKDRTVVLKVKKAICQERLKFIWTNFTFNDFRVEDVSIHEIIENAFVKKDGYE